MTLTSHSQPEGFCAQRREAPLAQKATRSNAANWQDFF
jgi:hypothetical protein